MITVLGATGKTGSVVAARLLAAGVKTRVAGRSAGRLRSLADRGASIAAGEVTDANHLVSAFDGAEALYAMIPPDYSQKDLRAFYSRAADAICTAVQRAGVRRVVFLSSLGAELPGGTGPIAGLHDAEERLKNTGAAVIALRPGFFYQNFLSAIPQIKHQGINGGAIEADVPFAMTSTADIGVAAAEELMHGASAGFTVRELLGPRDYTMSEATRILGQKIGKPDLKYVRFPDADFANALMQFGFSRNSANALVEMAHAISLNQVRSHQGRTPRTTMPTSLETFAGEFAAAYAKG